MAIRRVKLEIKGKVQNVNFRNFAKQNAGRLGISGYVKNLKNGNVEIDAQGEAHKLEEYLKLVRRGPMFAKVDSFTETDVEADTDEENSFFDIRYS